MGRPDANVGDLLIVIAAVYFWDVQYNETLSDGARSMGRSISHSFGWQRISARDAARMRAYIQATDTYSTETRTTPLAIMPRERAALTDRSITRPRINGPLSVMRQRIDRPE